MDTASACAGSSGRCVKGSPVQSVNRATGPTVKGFTGVRGDSHVGECSGSVLRRGRVYEVLDIVDFGSSAGMIQGRPGLSAPSCHDAFARLMGTRRGAAVKDVRKRWHADKIENSISSAADASISLSCFLEEDKPDMSITISRAAASSQTALIEGRRFCKVRSRR